MKALTLIQPWASLIRDGRKTIETRSWSTNHRGLLAIHAGKTVDAAACRQFNYDPRSIERGVILCTANLVAVVQFPHPRAKPDAYGDFTPGRYGWILASVTPLASPFPINGSLGLWTWES